MEMKDHTTKLVTIDDYDELFKLWNSTEQSRRALNPVDDSREGIERYLKRNPNTCFAAVQDGRIIGVILTGHDGRRGIIHHMCVHPEFRRMGIASHLVSEVISDLEIEFMPPENKKPSRNKEQQRARESQKSRAKQTKGPEMVI